MIVTFLALEAQNSGISEESPYFAMSKKDVVDTAAKLDNQHQALKDKHQRLKLRLEELDRHGTEGMCTRPSRCCRVTLFGR